MHMKFEGQADCRWVGSEWVVVRTLESVRPTTKGMDLICMHDLR